MFEWVVCIALVLMVFALWGIGTEIRNLRKLLHAASDLHAEKMDDVCSKIEDMTIRG